MPPVIDRALCTGCGTCVEICPLQVFRHYPKKDKVPVVAFADECWHCNSCVLDCRQKAMRLRIPMPFMMLHIDSADLHENRAANATATPKSAGQK